MVWTIPLKLKKLVYLRNSHGYNLKSNFRIIENFSPMESANKLAKKVIENGLVKLFKALRKEAKGKENCHLIRAKSKGISVLRIFGAMLHNISRDDLVDLYKIMLQKTTAYGPEEDLERAFG
ncbi:hypothetical protein Tco_1343998 [Tanacetum coccineum]